MRRACLLALTSIPEQTVGFCATNKGFIFKPNSSRVLTNGNLEKQHPTAKLYCAPFTYLLPALDKLNTDERVLMATSTGSVTPTASLSAVEGEEVLKMSSSNEQRIFEDETLPLKQIGPLAEKMDMLELWSSIDKTLAKRMGPQWKVICSSTTSNLFNSFVKNYEPFCVENEFPVNHWYSNCHIYIDGKSVGTLHKIDVKTLLDLSEPYKPDKETESVSGVREIKSDRIRCDFSVGSHNGINKFARCKLQGLSIYEAGSSFTDIVHAVHHAEFDSMLPLELHSPPFEYNKVFTSASPFGTTIVCLPTEHEGGDLIVRFNSTEQVVKLSEKSNDKNMLQIVSFYNDCEHELLPVTKGVRVVLEYSLFYNTLWEYYNEDDSDIKEPQPIHNSHVQSNHLIVDHFVKYIREEEFLQDFEDDTQTEPDYIGIYLVHSYPFKGFSSNQLKGIDKDLWDALLPHFELNCCTAVIDKVDHQEDEPRYSAHIFDHDLLFGLKTEHELLNKQLIILDSLDCNYSRRVLKFQEEVSKQPLKLTYTVSLMTIKIK